MNIAIIGTGNVGGALATGWSKKGHQIFLGVRNPENFKGKEFLSLPNISACPIEEAVKQSEVLVICTPAKETLNVIKSLGDTTGKIIIDTMNTIQKNSSNLDSSTSETILKNTQSKDVVKCFNTTGANNLLNPKYGETNLDMFMAGDSTRGKDIAKHLTLDLGFTNCYDVGGNDKFALMEEFAFFWINLAMFQKLGREIGFKLLKR
ncbi:MAG: NAD(P)-binding domain-containing protein [Leptospira sp.]|uniref:NADPH-dependent F420 reductase n=1 Tax=Leptospira sp. TaxID=178 RepID=UPI0025C0AD81|nr:NAD(P)-binding domain-containing protein [Leptospira sp.]MBL0953153.1 NAD(P)-binding domain-containing protein [Leptospira sp.]